MNDTTASHEAVVMERSFDAPVPLVWQMWTVPEHFAAWYGPVGATIPVARLDVRVGGLRLVCMEVPSPAGPRRMWFAGEHREVVENALLVYTEFVSDENGTPAPPARAPDGGHPITEVRVELTDLGGRTRLRLTHTGLPSDSPGAAGWTMALDKLRARLADTAGNQR